MPTTRAAGQMALHSKLHPAMSLGGQLLVIRKGRGSSKRLYRSPGHERGGQVRQVRVTCATIAPHSQAVPGWRGTGDASGVLRLAGVLAGRGWRWADENR